MDIKQLEDSVRGTLIGVALGDALGVPHEFRNQSKNVYTGTLYIPAAFNFHNFVKFSNVIGQWSDDTEMTLTLMRSIIEQKGYQRDKALLEYIEWAKNARLAGKNTRHLLSKITTGTKRSRPITTFENRWKRRFTGDPDKWTQSNGSLMRVSMLAFLNDESAEIEDCKITNPSKVNQDCNRLYCHFLRACVRYRTQNNKQRIQEALFELEICEEVQDVIASALSDSQTDRTRDVMAIGKGWVLHALYCSIWAFFKFDTYQESINAVIRLKGDTDTNAAIAGGPIGAYLGFSSVSSEKETKVNIDILLSADPSLGDNPLSEKHLLNDFDTLTKAFTDLMSVNWV